MEIWWVFLPFLFLIFFQNQAARQVCPHCGAQLGGPAPQAGGISRVQHNLIIASSLLAIVAIFLMGLVSQWAAVPAPMAPPRPVPAPAPPPRL